MIDNRTWQSMQGMLLHTFEKEMFPEISFDSLRYKTVKEDVILFCLTYKRFIYMKSCNWLKKKNI